MSVTIWELDSNTSLPLFDISSTGYVGSVGTADITLSLFTSTGQEQTWTADITVPLFELSATGRTGTTGTLTAEIPLFTAAGVMGRRSSGAVELPLFTVSGSGGPQTAWAFALEIPLFSVAGTGGAEISIGDYEVWVVNRETGAYSTYTAWPANSYGRFNGVDIIATATGLFALTGEEDDGEGIPIALYWPPSEFGTSKRKKIQEVYVDRRAGCDFSLVAITDETEKRIYHQDMAAYPEGMFMKRIQPTRDLRGTKWQFGIESTEGGGLTIAGLEIKTINLSRTAR